MSIVQARGNHSLGDKRGSNGITNSTETTAEDDTAEIAHLMWETVRVKVLRAGSLRKVIEAINNDDTDVQVLKNFILLVVIIDGIFDETI